MQNNKNTFTVLYSTVYGGCCTVKSPRPTLLIVRPTFSARAKRRATGNFIRTVLYQVPSPVYIVRAVTTRASPIAFRRVACGDFVFSYLLQGRLATKIVKKGVRRFFRPTPLPKASRSKIAGRLCSTVQSLQYIYYCTYSRYCFGMHAKYFRILWRSMQKSVL